MTTHKVVLVNDTSMYSAHFGTQLVGQTFREQFSRLGIELIGAVGREIDGHQALFSKADLLVINGEGSIHHGRNLHLAELANNFPCVLVNCVWDENPDVPALSQMRYISARESLSAEEISRQGVDCQVVPDVSFASMLLNAFQSNDATEDLGISDNVLDRESGFPPFVDNPYAYLNQLSRYRRLCLGRFHAIVAASVLKIPYSAWPSNTHKISGMMQDMGIEHLLGEDQATAIDRCPTQLDARVEDYTTRAKQRILDMFDQIASCI